ncbi:chitobiase/beta-hexosaminidase C-terminal domain-containing protein [Eubacteriaceae bacterium ES2]|nr:chitobiase/beta-hexosaminidase C-terminal domain-containing protein [Eubacteriaceae bacterium ES2]
MIGVGVLVALQVTERFINKPESQEQDESDTSAVVLQLPTYSLPSGTYTGEQTVVINEPDGQNVAVYYTIDGSSPSQTAIKYESPIIISSSLTLKSIAVDEAGNKSEIKTADYVIAAVQTPVQQPVVDTTASERAQFENNIRGTWLVEDGSGFVLYYDFYDGYFYSGDGGVFGYEGTYTYSIEPGNNGTIGTVYGAGLTMYIDCNPLGDNAIYINGDYASYVAY